MAEDCPCYAGVFELGDGNFAREGTVRLVEDVLGRYFDAFAEVLAGEEEIEGGRGDDDLCSLESLACSLLYFFEWLD